MRLPRPDRITIAVPGTAFAGMAMLLVPFAVVTTTYDTDRTPVAPPVLASGATVARLGTACVVVHREVDSGGRESVVWRFSDGLGMSHPVEPESLFFEASRVADRAPERAFLVKADAEANWADVDDVIEILRNAGVREIILWTSRAEADREEP